MNRKNISILLALILIISAFSFAYADEPVEAGRDWSVSFTKDGKLVNTYKDSDLLSEIKGLQPGDTMIIHIPIANNNTRTVDWYMRNIIQESPEDKDQASIRGGGYTYRLVYNGPGSDPGGDMIFDSENVGGENGVSGKTGLHEVSGTLENYFFLDTLKAGEEGQVDLTITLDGESQGNDYQDTLARLQFRFAVEIFDPAKPDDPPDVVVTGDTARPIPYFIALIVSGLILLYLALDRITDRKYGHKEQGEKNEKA